MELDTHYDRANAGIALDATIRKGATAVTEIDDTAIQHLSNVQMDHLVVQQTDLTQKMWRIMAFDSSTQDYCEVVFRIEGILASVDLVATSNMCEPKKAANLSQRIRLIGLNSAEFNDAIRQTKVIQGFFERHFGSQVSTWNVGDELGDPFINISANYFTRANTEGTAVSIELGDGVDPFGILRKFKTSGLIHTDDNQVKYFRKIIEADESVQYVTIFPGNLRVGDIVEGRASATVVGGKNGSLKVHFHLHSVILHNSKFSKAAEELRIRDDRVPVALKRPRRKGAFIEDKDVGAVRKKFRQMTVVDSEDNAMRG
ncbi:hypothetical protein C8R46DRAFT_1235775 [Mycena filopes]|nr:hypothetical protein C8R46DRAFT_1235775 [Mycena filopes]